MFNPAALFIGLRYTRAKRSNQFISLISLMSMLGIALGVTVLITVLSVLNGFDREIKKSIFGMVSPITINDLSGEFTSWRRTEATLQTIPGVTAIAPLVTGQALLQNAASTQPVMLIGILPQEEQRVSALSTKLLQGKLLNLARGQRGIILGERLAKQLNITIGDKLTIMTPSSSTSIANVTPHFEVFTVIDLFRAAGGALGFDAKLAFINLYDAQKIFRLNNRVTGLHANIQDVYAAPQIASAMSQQLPVSLQIINWTQQLGDFFENIRITKTMMFFIFTLIIIVAVFNLIASLIMIVNNKQADIAILRTMGATSKLIMAIFIVQGTLVGLVGTLLGILCGTLLAYNITAIVNGIQALFHVQLISANVYFINYLPSELQWLDVWKISGISFILCLFGTIYPAWNAARMLPSEALRDS